MAGVQLALSPRQDEGIRKRLVWQYKILLAGVAAVCSILLHLLIPQPGLTQSVVLPSASQAMQAQKSSLVAQRFQGKIISQVKLSSSKKAIALTFDDGPHPTTTPQVLSILKENHIKGTFFLIGQNLKNFPKIGQQIVVDGHVLGNHTWHHWGGQMMDFLAAQEIEDTAALIYKITGVKSPLFRPPHGYLFNGLADYARKRKDVVVLWTVDSGDWQRQNISVDGIVKQVVDSATPGGIVLMHDGGGDCSKTVQALPKIINELKERGYTFVSVPELLQMQDQQLNIAHL